MTTLDTTRSASASGIAGFVANLVGTVAAWNDARITRNSLMSLSSRELDDIGLTPGDIDAIANRGTRL